MPRAALFGHPVAHSRSPSIYAGFAQAAGTSFRFDLIDVPPREFATAVRELARTGAVGANVTLPHKLAALELCDATSERAALAGAVNTLRFESSALVFGDNTDGAGLVRDLTQNLGVTLHGARILVVGAGGACRGIAGPLLAQSPAELVIANRTPSRGATVAARFSALGRVSAAALENPGNGFDVVINATSASLHGDVPALPQDVFGSDALAVDLFYADDGETVFTRWAREHGAARTADGWGMLVEQAAESWAVWFGERPSQTWSRYRSFRRT